MKMEVVFLQSEDGDLSIGKLLALGLDIILAVFSYIAGKIFPLGLGILFPLFLISLPINIWFIIRSVKDNTFEILSLYLLPILIAFIIGILVDSNKSSKAEENLLEAQRYVEQYYEQNGLLPDNDDPKLKELDVDLQGEIFYINPNNYQLYTKQEFEEKLKQYEADGEQIEDFDADQFVLEYDYQLNAYGARIRRGDKRVHFYPRP
ncbi:MAG: hypothetical protein J5857_06715 [Treponema sp.]|nr:hypothetical protein [Treponema sp.]